MPLLLRKGSGSVERALVSSFNALRRVVADTSTFAHREVMGGTAGDWRAPTVIPLALTLSSATDLTSLLRLCGEIAQKHPAHITDGVAHKQPDGVNGLAHPPPDTLITAQSFLNDAKAKWDAHLAAPGVHVTNDPQTITAPDASDLQTAMDLANTYRAVFAAHVLNALPGASIQLIDP